MGKIGALIKDGEFVTWPDGGLVYICDYKNCHSPVVSQDRTRCEAHPWQAPKAKCPTCKKFTIKIERGVQLCPSCGSGKMWL